MLQQLRIMWRDRGKSHERIVLEAFRDGSEKSGAQILNTRSIGAGKLYPLLLNFEKLGILQSRWGEGDYPRPRLYKLTEKGLALVEESFG